MDGNPVRYAVENVDEFRLWSVGKDGVDDGGVAPVNNSGPLYGIDMVWPMPATAEQVRKKREELERERAAGIP